MEAHALGSGRLERARPRPPRLLAGDERLVAAVRAGSEDAFAAIFDRYHRQILSFCRHMLGNREESEDAVQATFLSAYRDMVDSKKAIQLRPWLYAIARNHCLSVLRARRESTSLDDVEPSVDGLAAEVQRRADLRDLLRDLARLPDDQRAALVLSEVGALSHDDIAGVLDCPREKVKALVFQARSALAADRAARDTPCADIRQQLATLRGGALRRGTLRRHLRDCPGCRDFQAQVKRQRAAMALLLPVVPSVGLRAGVLNAVHAAHAGGAAAGAGATAGGGAALAGGSAATGGSLGGALAGGGAAKLRVGAALLAGGVGSSVAAIEATHPGAAGPASKHAPAATTGLTPGSPTGPASRASTTATGDVPPDFAPTRARGQQALAAQGLGVANGQLAKGVHGRSDTAPGNAGTSAGGAGTSPGGAGNSPGLASTSPGKAGTNPRTDHASSTTSGGGSSQAGTRSNRTGSNRSSDVTSNANGVVAGLTASQ